MTDTLTRAARALAKAQSGVEDFDLLDDEMQDTLRDNVRAVLEAIREPTDHMLSDGAFQIFKGERITEDDIHAAKRVWRAMTKTALSE